MHKFNYLKLIILVSTILILVSCNKGGDTNFSIKGNIAGIEDGRKVSLKIQEGKDIVTIDSTELKDGKFNFKGKIEEPTYFGVFVDKIEQGIFPIVDVDNNLDIEIYKDSLFATKIVGSPYQDELNKLYDEKKKISEKMKPIFSEFQAAQKSGDTKKRDEINARLRKIQNEVSTNDWNFIKNNPDSHISSVIIGNLMRDPVFRDSCIVGFNNLTDRVKNSKLAAPLKEYFEKEAEKIKSAKEAVEILNKK